MVARKWPRIKQVGQSETNSEDCGMANGEGGLTVGMIRDRDRCLEVSLMADSSGFSNQWMMVLRGIRIKIQ